MKKQMCMVVLGVVCGLGLKAQLMEEPLGIGDPVPDLTFHMVNYERPTARLSEFKGKAVLLDCWTTHCAPCVLSLPRMDSLQTRYSKDLVILPVSVESRADITNFSQRFNRLKGIKLVSAADDVDVRRLFPYDAVPHYIWLDKNHIVRAISSDYEAINDASLEDLINGRPLGVVKDQPTQQVAQKADAINASSLATEPVDVLRTRLRKDSSILYYSGLQGYDEAERGGAGDLGDFLDVTNLPLAYLYGIAYGDGNRKVITRDSLRFFANAGQNGKDVSGDELVTWAKVPGRVYCYTCKVPPGTSQLEKCRILQQHLKSAFPFIDAKKDRVKKDAYVLRVLAPKDSASFAVQEDVPAGVERTPYYLYANKVSMGRICSELKFNIQQQDIEVVDETNFTGKAGVRIEAEMRDVVQVNAALKKFNLVLVKKPTYQDVLILTDIRN